MSDPDPNGQRNFLKAVVLGFGDQFPVLTRLPASFELYPGWLPHLGAAIVGYLLFVLVLFLTLSLAFSDYPRDDFAEFLFTAALPSLGFLALVGASLWLPRRLGVALSRQIVTVQEDGLRGRREWSEPITAFAGLALRVRRTKTKADKSSLKIGTTETTHYWIELVHPTAARTLILYYQKNGMAPLERIEDHAKLLGREIVDTGGIRRMTPEEAAAFTQSFAETERELGGRK
ncbi:MAG: hypothetical protein HY246_23770 [Proteobacteria bacterium]|nr:hypothetical protein [Pseudomonadota bacterium]